jgi:hypothetical protein
VGDSPDAEDADDQRPMGTGSVSQSTTEHADHTEDGIAVAGRIGCILGGLGASRWFSHPITVKRSHDLRSNGVDLP